MATKKILVNVSEKLVDGLKKRMDQACLKRDAYLDHVLRHEATQLQIEVPTANSDRAYAYIAQELNQLDRKPLNLQLSEETIELINKVCEQKKIPRDAFIHRVLLLLLSGQKTIEAMIPEDWEWARIRLIEDHPDELYDLFTSSTLLTIAKTVESDPFWYLRRCLEVITAEEPNTPTLYSAIIGKHSLMPFIKNAIGFNCYLPDSLVEGTPENNEAKKQIDDFLRELEG